ncbi:MAG: GNAT family N-acetyltransferase [Methylobacterium sp.]|nr:MAG: GNAT family N-acetyltransferase [Methylobacterium sp.]
MRPLVSVQLDPNHDEVTKAVREGLVAYNKAEAGDGNWHPVTISVRDGDAILGGAVARFFHGWIYVDLLWISEELRGQDIGSRVMDELEAYARSLGGRGIHLTTYSWQARPFYEKRGFRVFGEISPYPEGHSCYWLSKTL